MAGILEELREYAVGRRDRSPWYKKTWRVIVKWKWLVIISALVGILKLWHSYTTTGADELRAEVYRPLYVEFEGVENSIRSLSLGVPLTIAVLPQFKQTGALGRVVPELRAKLNHLSERASRLEVAATTVNRMLAREMSARIMQIRSEESDQKWSNLAEGAIRQVYRSQRGAPDGFTFTLKHAGRSRAIDVKTGEPASPGGNIVGLADWLEFPGSLDLLKQDWKDFDYLYFHPVHDVWYYRITKDDLQRAGVSLEVFLAPVHEILLRDVDYKYVSSARPQLLRDLSVLKATLGERIDSPKQVTDLIPRW